MKIAAVALVLAFLPGCMQGTFGPDPVSPYDYLRGGGTWVIEVDHVQGHAPTPAALDAVKTRMAALAVKDSIQVHRAPQGVTTADASWTVAEIQALHKQTLDNERGDGRVVTHVLYLDGRFHDGSGDTNALGVTIGYDLVAIFIQAIDDACTPLNACLLNEVEIETAVLIHEFGHAIGLVDRGIPMVNDHEDDQHEGHSSNPDSVMFWQVETAAGVLGISRIPTEFDANDRRDVCAAGGRC